jgi:mono/diheme cytochrome c family protein
MKTRDCSTAEWNKSWSDAKIKEAIENGVTGEREGVKKQMDGYKDKLKPEQVDALVKYMRTLQK